MTAKGQQVQGQGAQIPTGGLGGSAVDRNDPATRVAGTEASAGAGEKKTKTVEIYRLRAQQC